MVTDMHRLEHAARLSMGDFEAASPATAPPALPRLSAPRLSLPLKVLAALVICAALAIGVPLLG